VIGPVIGQVTGPASNKAGMILPASV
jgi:hypothetical protein